MRFHQKFMVLGFNLTECNSNNIHWATVAALSKHREFSRQHMRGCNPGVLLESRLTILNFIELLVRSIQN